VVKKLLVTSFEELSRQIFILLFEVEIPPVSSLRAGLIS
jgi:hypothetical protein